MKYIKQKKQIGFSLIELMFAVIIIGILSGIALPIYQDFSSKTQIQSAHQELSNLKNPIDITSFRGDTLTSTVELGWQTGASSFFHTAPIVSIDSDTGTLNLEAVIDGNVQAIAKGVKITLIRKKEGGWSCEVKKSNSTAWKNSFVPGHCQVTE